MQAYGEQKYFTDHSVIHTDNLEWQRRKVPTNKSYVYGKGAEHLKRHFRIKA